MPLPRIIRNITGSFIFTLVTLLAAGANADILFTDVSQPAGVHDYTYGDKSNHALGLNWIDYNNDDWPDLFLVNGATHDPHLFRNNGNGTFTNADEHLPLLPDIEMMGSVFADYDRDGDKDIYIFTNVNRGPGLGNGGPPNLLLRNLWAENGNRVVPGQPLFEEVAAQIGLDDLMNVPGVDGPGHNAPTGAWLDYDRDGYIDLFVGHWAGAPDEPAKDRLYRNTPGGPLPFTDVTTAAGINQSTGAQPVGDILAMMAGHLNDDMWPDIYVANFKVYDHDLLYENQAGTFTEVIDNSPGMGDDANAAMGLAFGDVENDGDWDLYISNLSGNPFYINESPSGGGLLFQDDSATARGIRAANSWGVNFFDADQDGDVDLFVATMTNFADLMYENDGLGNFTEIPMDAISQLLTTRGSALADYDRDGDLDLGVVNANATFQLFRNDSPAPGHWLQLKLVGVTSNVDAIGAKVRVTTGSRTVIRQITGGNSAHSQDSPVVHVGLGSDTVADVEIFWPSGAVKTLSNVAADRFITLVEGDAGPSVSISSPVAESVFGEGAVLTFSGRANNTDGVDLTSALTWSSSLDGVIGSGGSFTSALSVGTHTITATASDGSLSGSATVGVTINPAGGGNTSPVVTISAPANGSAWNEGASVTFTGSASDTEDGNLAANLSWSSSINGVIGSGGSFSTSGLSLGTHTITASVTDSGGLPGSAVRTVTINPAGGGNTVPVVTITAPVNGSAFDAGTSVTFTGSASDTEDGDVTLGLSWSSSINGPIPGGSGGSFSTSGLSAGTHTITASVTDSGGLPGSAVRTVTINPTGGTPGELTFTSRAAEDGMVIEAGESKEVGGNFNSNRNTLVVGDNNADKQTLAIVSFDTSTLPAGAAIISAKLRLKRNSVEGTNPFETHGAALVDIQTGGFSGNAALQSGDFEASATAVAAATLNNALNDGDWSEGVLDAAGVGAINPAGMTQLRIRFTLDDNDDRSRDIIRYFSGNDGNAANHPQLIVTTDISGNALPIVSISNPANDSEYVEGTSVTFSGSASDTEDGDVTAGLSWRSSIDSDIGSGASFSTSALSAGTHTITASVTDSGGLTGLASLSVTISAVPQSVARQWNDELLNAIRHDFARPTMHARNLYHTSVAMWDAWAAYDGTAGQVLHSEKATAVDVEAARGETLSYAVYRLLSWRFASSPGAAEVLPSFDNKMDALGYDRNITSTAGNTPAELGNRIAETLIAYGLSDGANETGDFVNQYYSPVNAPLAPEFPGNPNLTDPNRWQPLVIDPFVDQSGNPIDGFPEFLSPEWGIVKAFALSEDDLTIYNRDGFDYWVYHDPGAPPQLGDPLYTAGFEQVIEWSGALDPADGVMIDIGPGARGDNTLGTNDGNGHDLNPATGLPYEENTVPAGDYYRILAEFWADGPASETPPGHWFTIANYVSDHPQVVKQFGGTGPVLEDLEWDVKSYLALGGAMHDSAVASWGVKGWYDYIRPVSAIRGLCDSGQSSDPSDVTTYNVNGINLHPGYIELVTTETAAAGGIHEHLAGNSGENIGKIAIYAWRGPDYINNPDTDTAGVDWILCENWWPYQRPSFVTPPFAGYVSGHSTFSRAAAEVMTLITGDAYFPGGMGTFLAPRNEFLVFEEGPSVDITLQWATYADASDETSLSRIYGGIHPTADDIPGRLMGYVIGPDAFNHAVQYFNGEIGVGPTVSITAPADGASFEAGTDISFTAIASDTEDGDVTAGLLWSSSIDGAIGSGASFNTSVLSVGTHTITAAVTDSGGLPGSAVLTVSINPTGGTPGTQTFTSSAAEDGIVIEAGETKEVGGGVNASRNTMVLGDNHANRQYRAIVSFDTSTLPAGALITSVTLRLKRASVSGSNPFDTHGAALVDIQTGGFSGDTALQASDFEASATAVAVATLGTAANDGDWSEGVLDAAGVGAINRTGLTQLRVYFTLDDNDDLTRDLIRYFSGNDGNAGNHPQLVVDYQ